MKIKLDEGAKMPTRAHKKDPLYGTWRAMRERCRRQNHVNYSDYGGRGIKVCIEWEDFEVFRKWACENGYEIGLSIDRKDVNGNYEPSNCRFATSVQQANNKRNNHLITYNGVTATAAEWSKITGIPYRTILSRINRDKLPLEQVFVKKILLRDTKTGRYISVKEQHDENCFR